MPLSSWLICVYDDKAAARKVQNKYQSRNYNNLLLVLAQLNAGLTN